jgi:hypothetical protein
MDINFHSDSFLAGLITGLVISGFSHISWLIVIPFLLIDFKIKGMPFAKLTYSNEEGWKFTKGRH